MSSEKLTEFTVKVQSGLLQSLGIDMYATLGKCLVEFIANAYDGEAPSVHIQIPFEQIELARVEVRKAATAKVKSGKIDPFSVLNDPLPEDIGVTIRDDGHGMTPGEVQEKFLPITRNRRLDAKGQASVIRSENGKRLVMGRKGLGKLAGFGVAERIEIETKKEGDDFTTTFVLDQREFEEIKEIRDVPIKPGYSATNDIEAHFTEIRLARLKCDAVRQSDQTLKTSLVTNFFGIDPKDFAIHLNGELVVEEPKEYDLIFPEKRDGSGFAADSVTVEDGSITVPFKYVVKFRKPGQHLTARNRGARVYCNSRLAAGPTLLNVPTGLHSFHSTDYMESIIIADELDRHGVDLINTNRTQLKENNELVQVFLDKITDLMTEGIKAHGKHRDAIVEKELQEHPAAKLPVRIVENLPKKTRTVGRRLLNIVARRFPPGSQEFEELAPLIVQSMNAGEVLIKLSEAGVDPKDLNQIGDLLRDLADIERSDVLKLYRGRRSGISALEKLIEKGEEFWRKKQFEDELHELLKENPWLIRPEYSRFIASNQSMDTVATELAKFLSIDDFAPAEGGKQDAKRPDLVFAMADAIHPHEIHIVELKSPALPLEYDHLDQLRDYMFRARDFLQKRYRHPIRIFGTLIGARPNADTQAHGGRRLNSEIADREGGADWEVKDVRELLQDSKRAHLDEISSLEKEEVDREDDQEERRERLKVKAQRQS